MDENSRKKLRYKLFNQYRLLTKDYQMLKFRLDSSLLMSNLTKDQADKKIRCAFQKVSIALTQWYRSLSQYEQIAVLELSIDHPMLWRSIEKAVEPEMALYRTLVS